MDLIVATNNGHKLEEIRKILGGAFENVWSLKDKGIDIDVEENGTTFLENAEIKARAIYDIIGIPTLADDSGICVDSLNGAPGVLSARYAGNHGENGENNALLLKNLLNNSDRNAHFTCAIVLITDNKTYKVEGKTEGYILRNAEGTNGFGYDPLFYSIELNKPFGLATDEEKNSVSHRGKALSTLVAALKKDNLL